MAIDIFVVLLICVVFVVTTLESGYNIEDITQPLYIIIVIYIAVELIFNYRLGLSTIVDRKKEDYIQKEGTIVDYEVESSWSGWLMISLITKMYPKELAVNRYRILFKDLDGNISFVRIVMTRDKGIKIYNSLLNKSDFSIRLVFCKRSKILICFELGEIQTAKSSKGLSYRLDDINKSF